MVKIACKYCGIKQDPSNLARHEKNFCEANGFKRKEQLGKKCRYCDTQFKRGSHCKRHEEETCKMNPKRLTKK